LQPRQGLDYSSAKIIKLAGMEYFVPVLALRQNRALVPLLQRVLPRLKQIGDGVGIREQDYDDLTVVAHVALTRAYPDITIDQLLETNISLEELILAAPVIMEQTRAFKTIDPGTSVGEPKGEATASTAPPQVSID
jgi:hypothetical protein